MSGLVGVLIGVVLGVGATAALVVWLMRSRMVVPHRSERSFEDTCTAIEAEVPAAGGWSFPAPGLDMYQKLADKGLEPDGLRRIQLYFVCNPAIARRVLSEEPKMSGIMPCSWAVYERDDGSVWLTKMNISMMSRLFSGEVGAAMGEVAAADAAFMETVLRRPDGGVGPGPG